MVECVDWEDKYPNWILYAKVSKKLKISDNFKLLIHGPTHLDSLSHRWWRVWTWRPNQKVLTSLSTKTKAKKQKQHKNQHKRTQNPNLAILVNYEQNFFASELPKNNLKWYMCIYLFYTICCGPEFSNLQFCNPLSLSHELLFFHFHFPSYS